MIKVEREDPTQPAFIVGNCCFCRQPTSFWNREKDVACCPECAARASIEDVPDKQTWCRREEIASGSDALETIALERIPVTGYQPEEDPLGEPPDFFSALH